MAEVLITLGIIGVVAALTIPSLIAEHRAKVTVTRVKHAYSVLSQAYRLAVLEDERTPKAWGLNGMADPNSHINIANRFKPHLKVLKDCVGKSAAYVRDTCYDAGEFEDVNSWATLVINNGTLIAFRNWSPDCTHFYGNIKNVCGEIGIDINGKSKPNLRGEDIFLFYLTDDRGIIPTGIQGDDNKFSELCRKGQASPVAGFRQMYACTAWVIYNENLDYLKCPDKLDWDKQSSCDGR